jgi:hypothetical protein
MSFDRAQVVLAAESGGSPAISLPTQEPGSALSGIIVRLCITALGLSLLIGVVLSLFAVVVAA